MVLFEQFDADILKGLLQIAAEKAREGGRGSLARLA